MIDVLQQRIKGLERKLKRVRRKVEYYQNKYDGNEEDFTYHAGWNLGYWLGVESEIEDNIDALKEIIEDNLK